MTITIRGDFDHLVSHQRLEKLKQCLYVTEEYLGKAKEEFEAKSCEELGLNLYPKDVCDDIYNEEQWYYAVKFPRIVRNSFLVTTLSLLEYEINVICNKLKIMQTIPINLSDLKGDVLDRTKIFYKLAGLDLQDNNLNWQEINKYYLVRNCIAHNNGLISGVKKEKELRVYITRKKIISEDKIDEEIALTASFCKEVIKTIQYFLNDVYEAISIAKNKLKSDNKKQGV